MPLSKPPIVKTCPHGRPLTRSGRWDWFFGIEPCEDCGDEDWERVRNVNRIGVTLLAAMILVPAFFVLLGMF